MRFLPLIPSSFDPEPWRPQGSAMLRWEGATHPGWPAAVAQGLVVAAVVLGHAQPLEEGLEVLRLGLGPDFLVVPAGPLVSREAGFRLLGTLEALLEATAGRGVKLALWLEPGTEASILDLLRQARGEAVGFCWHPGLADPEPLADRLWCAVCAPDSHLGALQALGYRWDMGVPAASPQAFREDATRLEVAHPPVLFPAVMPTTALGRPVVPDDSLTFGKHWGEA